MNALNIQHRFQLDFQKTSEYCMKHNESKIQIGGRTVCKSCCIESVQVGNKKHQDQVDHSIREKHFASAMLPTRHADCGFKNYNITNDGQRISKAECLNFARTIISGGSKNLVMTGRTGTGKTHLACAVARNVMNNKKYARYITSEDMATDVSNAWKKADDSEASAIYRYTDYDLLIIDEYGLHDQHESRLQLVHKVLYSRYDAKRPTMIISNFTLAELRNSLWDRLWSRLQHDGLIQVECNWADARLSA